MPKKRIIRSDQEWLELIQECRTSGLSDREWCQLHSISIKTFHNKVSNLRKKACVIPESQAMPPRQKQEVVPLKMDDSPALCPDHPADSSLWVTPTHAAVTVRLSRYSVEIADGASEDTIRSTLLALGRLC